MPSEAATTEKTAAPVNVFVHALPANGQIRSTIARNPATAAARVASPRSTAASERRNAARPSTSRATLIVLVARPPDGDHAAAPEPEKADRRDHEGRHGTVGAQRLVERRPAVVRRQKRLDEPDHDPADERRREEAQPAEHGGG